MSQNKGAIDKEYSSIPRRKKTKFPLMLLDFSRLSLNSILDFQKSLLIICLSLLKYALPPHLSAHYCVQLCF